MKTQVFSYGGGVQSIAIVVLILQGKLPRPDFVCIADTGREKATTWDYLDNFTGPALEQVGLPVHRPHKDKYAYKHDDIFSGDTLLIPAFTTENSQVSKLSGYCSKWWKKETVDNFLKREFCIAKADTRNWIGFSTDEPKRFHRMMASDDYRDGRIFIPLVEAVRMNRGECVELVRAFGWPTPPRSSCWMCPNARDDEWREIKENRPEEFEAAFKLDEEIRLRDPHAWLHESAKPLREVDLSRDGQREMCLEGNCFT